MLAHVPSFRRNPRGSPDFLAHPVPKACMHVLGTGVPRRLGVARSSSGPKAAQALGCSLTPGLRISFGRVTCMARAASVSGLWTLGFLLLRGACVWVWVVGCRLRPATPVWGLGWVCFDTGCGFALHFFGWGLRCLRLGLGFGPFPTVLGWGFGACVVCARSACILLFPARVCGVAVCAWVRVSAAPRHSWARCWGMCVVVYAPHPVPCTSWPGLRCGGVCSGLGCCRAQPLLAGVLGRVFACVRAPPVPRPSWLGCAVWACHSGCWGVCAFVRVPLFAPRHSSRGGVCVSLFGFCLISGFSPGLGAGVRGLLYALRSFPVTFWGTACGVGVCGCCCGWGLFPPPLWFLFLIFAGGGCRGVSCRGLVVSVAGRPSLGSRAHCPPFPSRSGCAFVLFFLPVPALARCVSACSGCPSLPWAAALGWVLLVLAGWSSGVPWGDPVFGAVRLGALAASRGWAASWLWAFLVPPPPLFFRGGGAACSSLCLPWVGARTGRHSVWSTGLL